MKAESKECLHENELNDQGNCIDCGEFACEHEEFEDMHCLVCGVFAGELFDYSDYYEDR